MKENLGIDQEDTDDDDKLALNINAANELVAGLRVAQASIAHADVAAPRPWGYTLVTGATLLASRWFRRSNSPAGVIDLGGEAGVAYVQRNDPDIAQMLGLGPYTRPAIG